MKSMGFDTTPFEMHSEKGRPKMVISLAVGTVNTTKSLPQVILNSLKAKRAELEQELSVLDGAPSVGAAVREIRAHHSVMETKLGVETALTLIRNVLTSPQDIRMYRVKKSNPAFFRTLGRLQAAELLMKAIGFASGSDRDAGEGAVNAAGAIYVLHSVGGNGSFDASKHLIQSSISGAGNGLK